MRKGDPGNPNRNLPPIIMVQWKMAVSPILVSFHWMGSFPLNPWIDGRKSKPSFSDGNSWLHPGWVVDRLRGLPVGVVWVISVCFCLFVGE